LDPDYANDKLAKLWWTTDLVEYYSRRKAEPKLATERAQLNR